MGKKPSFNTPSATNAWNDLALTIGAAGTRPINLSLGRIGAGLDPRLARTAAAAVADPVHAAYTPALGHMEFRQAIAEGVAYRLGLPVRGQNVGLTAGGKEALFLVLFAHFQRRTVMVTPPTWGTFWEQAEAVGSKVCCSRVSAKHNFFPTPRQIRNGYNKGARVFLLCYPANPHGGMPTFDQLDAVLDTLDQLRQRDPDVCVVLDASYSRIVLSPFEYPAWSCSEAGKRLFQTGALIEIHPFSKSCAVTGWRVAYVLGHEERIRRIGNLKSQICGNMCTPLQHTAIRMAAQEDRLAAGVRDLVAQNLERLRAALPALRLEMDYPPRGGIFAYVSCAEMMGARHGPQKINSAEQYARLLAHYGGVALIPGTAFRDREPRLRIVVAEQPELIAAALERIRGFNAQLRFRRGGKRRAA